MPRAPIATVTTALALAACTSPPVAWRELVYSESSSLDESGGVLSLSLDARGAQVERVPFPEGSTPALGDCEATRRHARAAGLAYAAWWRVRPDSSAELLVARSDDGGASWSAASVAESRDRSSLGCARPAPAVAVDSASGTVHVAYWATPPDGPGVFFSHATGAQGTGAPSLPPEHLAHMGAAADTAGRAAGVLWHAPVAVVHGERPSGAAVAVRGDTVVVAFEDPNSGPRPRIAVALSRQMGHRFDARDHAVSPGEVAAASPAVALRGDAVAVAWREEGRPRSVATRVGRIDWRAAARAE